MDISDKIINVCIIFAILAILSIIFGCFYLSNKSENFKDVSESKEKSLKKEIVSLLANKNTSDKLILDFMKKNRAFFKNEKFVANIVKELKKEDFKTKETNRKEPLKTHSKKVKSD